MTAKTSFSPSNLNPVELDCGRRPRDSQSGLARHKPCTISIVHLLDQDFEKKDIMDVTDEEFNGPDISLLKGRIVPVPTVQETNPTFEFGRFFSIYLRG